MLRKFIFPILLLPLSVAHAAYLGHWVSSTDVPNNAFAVGRDTNGTVLFACRARFAGGVHPGKVWQGGDYCHISYGGQEYLIKRFQVLTVTGSPRGRAVYWQPVRNGQLPLNAVAVGQEANNGQALYLCRASAQRSLQPGKTWAGYDGCNYGYGGKELIARRYKVLVYGNSFTPAQPYIESSSPKAPEIRLSE